MSNQRENEDGGGEQTNCDDQPSLTNGANPSEGP